VAGGRLLHVGTTAEVERLAGPSTEVLDAEGRTVLPGFVDAHVHLIWGYELGTWLDLSDRPSLKEVQRRLLAYADAHPGEEILVGQGFDYAALGTGALPSKEDLDVVVRDRPVLLLSYDGHTGWANSRFVERAAAACRSVGRDVGEAERDPRTGEFTGVFRRAFDVMGLLPEIRRRRSIEGLRKTVSMASRLGITTAFDVQVELDDVDAYDELRRRGGLTVRIRAAIHHPRGTDRSLYGRFLEARERYRDDWYRADAVKLYIDGVQETGTAALLEPYADNVASRGETVWSEEELEALVSELDRLGFQVCIHACGDRGVRMALDAYERILTSPGTHGQRHRIEHCEMVAPQDLPRFHRLGVIPCMMPRHASPEVTTRWREAVGRERAQASFPWRSLLDSGASVAFASDWPVADLDPLVGIQEAVTRCTPEGDPSPQRLSLEEALHAYTLGAAYACAADSTRGSLVAGKYADFLVLSDDLFGIPADRIRDVHVVRTVVGGRTVFASGP